MTTRIHASAGAALLLGLAILAHLSGGCASKNQSDAKLCSAGTFVFCRCQDQSEGSKQCAADGQSFGACLPCSGDSLPAEDAGPAPTDAGFKHVDADAGPPKPGPTIDAQCGGKLAVLAGSDDPSNEYLYASVFDGKAFQSFSSNGVPLRSAVAIAPTGTSLMAVYRSRNDWLIATTFSSGGWGTPSQIGGASASSAPALATWGTSLKAIYHGGDGRYHATTYTPGTGWDGSPVTLGLDSAPAISNGSAPSATTAGTAGVPGAAILVGFTDGAQALYRQEWRGTSWLALPIKATSVLAANQRPAIVALTGGPYELLSTYVGGDGALHSATRTASDHGSMWSNPGLVDAQAMPMDGANVAALDAGRALLVYRDANKNPFFTIFDPNKTPSWTAPAELVAGKNPKVASTPYVIQDRCGADAAVVYAEDGGNVAIVRYKNSAWEGPFVVSGLTKLTYAAIGELP